MTSRNSQRKHRFLAVSLFTGAGGLDIGMERAGFHVISMAEIESVFCETLQKNKTLRHPISGLDGHYHFEGSEIIQTDIEKISGKKLFFGKERLDCIFGGPPCQPFSSAGKMGSVSDPRGTLFKDFIRIVKELRPRTVLFENVRGLVTARCDKGSPGGVLQIIISEFERIGYSCRVALLNAADFGAFQRRVRFFLLATDSGKAPEFPAATHTKFGGEFQSLLQNTVSPWRNLSEFLEEYSDGNKNNWVKPTEALAEKLKNVSEGSGLKSAGVIETTRPGGHWGYRQGTFISDPKLPARTVTGSSSQDWIRMKGGALRRLTFKEVSLLQGFPENWEFAGNQAQKFKQVGNAVPTIFSEVLGKTLQNYLSSQYEEGQALEKIPIPPTITKHIKYTQKEENRNGESRRRKKPAPLPATQEI